MTDNEWKNETTEQKKSEHKLKQNHVYIKMIWWFWSGVSHSWSGGCLNEHFSIIELWNAFDNYLSGLIVFPSAWTDGSVNWTKWKCIYATTTHEQYTFLSCMRNTNLIGIKWKRAFLCTKLKEKESFRPVFSAFNIGFSIHINYRYCCCCAAALRDWRLQKNKGV